LKLFHHLPPNAPNCFNSIEKLTKLIVSGLLFLHSIAVQDLRDPMKGLLQKWLRFGHKVI